jgi:hypothetical protein
VFKQWCHTSGFGGRHPLRYRNELLIYQRYLATQQNTLFSELPNIMYHLIHNISQLRTPSVVDYNYLTFCMKAYHTSPQRLAWLRLPKLAPNVPVIQHKVALYVTACQAAVEGVDMSCNSPPPGERQLCDAPRTTMRKASSKALKIEAICTKLPQAAHRASHTALYRWPARISQNLTRKN